MTGKIVILMGSEKDLEFSREIAKQLKTFSVDYEFRVASAHKTPQKVLGILKEFEEQDIVYITVAGRSNALSGFVDANTLHTVIACPVYSEKFSGADIYSSLRVPSGVAPLVTIEPEAAAIAATKILAHNDSALQKKLREYQRNKRNEIDKADESVRKLK
jgi:5-(carboxyamino)imidazole ribonucleotide mutase